MFGIKRKKPFVLDVEKTMEANRAYRAYEDDGDPALLYAFFGAERMNLFFPHIEKPVAAVAADDDPLTEGK